MKLNWGSGIAIVYSCFAASMIFMVTQSRKHLPDMVRKDYYQLDLDYQQHLDKKQRAIDLYSPTKALVKDGYIQVQFMPSLENVGGELKLYRYNSENDTFTTKIKVDAGNTMMISAENLAKGRWHIEADWAASELAYFEEFDVWL